MSIVISGNPGVGKHTITEEISRILGLPIIDINKVAKDTGLFEKNNNTHDVDTKKLGKVFDERISENNIIVGHLAPYVLDKNKVKKIIILRRNPYHLISVYRERAYTERKIIENIGSEVLGVIAYDAMNKFQEKAFQVNIKEKKIQETVRKSIGIIFNNENGDTVDWLELITKNNDLEKFFID